MCLAINMLRFLIIVLSNNFNCIFVFPTVMSFPYEVADANLRHTMDDVKTFLDSKHQGSYAIYNCSPRSYKTAKFHNRVCILFNETFIDTFKFVGVKLKKKIKFQNWAKAVRAWLS